MTAPAPCPLSPRDLALLEGVASGLSSRQLAERFGLSEQTVKNALSGALRSLGVADRTAAVVLALQRGWLCLDAITVAMRSDDRRAPAPPERAA